MCFIYIKNSPKIAYDIVDLHKNNIDDNITSFALNHLYGMDLIQNYFN